MLAMTHTERLFGEQPWLPALEGTPSGGHRPLHHRAHPAAGCPAMTSATRTRRERAPRGGATTRAGDAAGPAACALPALRLPGPTPVPATQPELRC